MQANDPYELTPDILSKSIKQFMNLKKEYELDIRFMMKKLQQKVFIEIDDRSDAKFFFRTFYKMPYLIVIDKDGSPLFERKMRCYLIKDEGAFEQLAIQKKNEENGIESDRNTVNSSTGS